MADDASLLLDVTRLIWRRWMGRYPTGIDRVCLAYLSHFGSRAQAVVQHERFRRILNQYASQELFELLESPPTDFRRKLPLRVLRHWRGLHCEGQDRIYLNIGHTGLNSNGFRDWADRSHVRPVYLVHDLIPLTHPQFCRPGEASKHRERMRTVLETAAGVIGNSQATLDELAQFAASEGLSNPPALAAWLGSDPLSPPDPAEAPDRPTFVTLGTIEARKNHLLLLHVWSHLVDRLGDQAPQLLIIGQRGWEAQAVFDILDRSEKLRGHVVELNECSDEELGRHLGSARALLFPSLAEGYGLPLIEALQAGTPVLANDLPIFREIGQGIPDLIDRDNGAAWERAILSYVEEDSPARAAQLSRLKSFRTPTWADHFAKVDSLLASI